MPPARTGLSLVRATVGEGRTLGPWSRRGQRDPCRWSGGGGETVSLGSWVASWPGEPLKRQLFSELPPAQPFPPSAGQAGWEGQQGHPGGCPGWPWSRDRDLLSPREGPPEIPVMKGAGCLGRQGGRREVSGQFLSSSEGRFLAHQLREKHRLSPRLSLGF